MTTTPPAPTASVPGTVQAPPTPDRRTSRRRAGDAAEASAARFLAARGLVPLARQWARRIGELDLVMVCPRTGTIVFVEVRYRASGTRGGATGSVDARKRRRLRLAAAAWLQRHADPRRPARIDVIGMMPGAPLEASGEPRAARGAGVAWEGYRLDWRPGAVEG